MRARRRINLIEHETPAGGHRTAAHIRPQIQPTRIADNPGGSPERTTVVVLEHAMHRFARSSCRATPGEDRRQGALACPPLPQINTLRRSETNCSTSVRSCCRQRSPSAPRTASPAAGEALGADRVEGDTRPVCAWRADEASSCWDALRSLPSSRRRRSTYEGRSDALGLASLDVIMVGQYRSAGSYFNGVGEIKRL